MGGGREGQTKGRGGGNCTRNEQSSAQKVVCLVVGCCPARNPGELKLKNEVDWESGSCTTAVFTLLEDPPPLLGDPAPNTLKGEAAAGGC